jgi:hypothetical protein
LDKVAAGDRADQRAMTVVSCDSDKSMNVCDTLEQSHVSQVGVGVVG